MNTAPAKAYKGMGMEGFVAKWYAANTRKGLEEFKALARQVASGLPPGSRVLEAAPGPGYFAIELAKLGGYRVTGLDISETFVEIANRNAKEAGVEIDFRQGNVSGMPFEDATFDFVFCRAAFKNFSDPAGALQEMYRTLKTGGKGLILDLRKDAPPEAIAQAVDGMGLNPINKVLTKLAFRFMLLKRAYTEKRFREFFSRSGFRAVDIQEDLIGLEIRFEKP